MGLYQLLKCLGFSLYPLSFFLYSPFKLTYVYLLLFTSKLKIKLLSEMGSKLLVIDVFHVH